MTDKPLLTKWRIGGGKSARIHFHLDWAFFLPIGDRRSVKAWFYPGGKRRSLFYGVC
jgi:hypothetical protein